MALEAGDIVVNLVRGLNGAYFQLRHIPTGVETEPLPREVFHASRTQLQAELEQKVADKLSGKTDFQNMVLKPEDLEIEIGRGNGGDFARIRHVPTQARLGPFLLADFNRNRKQIMAQLDALVSAEMMMEPRSRYFPLELGARFLIQHYRKHLLRMHENSFWQVSANPGLHAYRFLWLRTFDQPIMIRLELEPGPPLLTAKITSGRGGYEPGQVVYREELSPTPQQVEKFLSQLEAAQFWKAPVTAGGGLDGAHWILEGIRGGQYRFVEYWSPPPENPFRQAVWTLVELVGLEVENIY